MIGIIGLVLFFFLKRRRDLDDFDGNFDPDRVVGHSTGGGTLPQIDLREEVTPFEYGAPGVGEPAGSGNMSQYGDNPYFVTGAGQVAPSRSMSPPSHYRNPSSEGTVFNQPAGTGSDTTGSNYGPSIYGGGLPPGAAAGAVRVPSPPGSTSSMSQPRSAKEREAMAQRFGLSGGLGLATQHEEHYDPAAGPANAGGHSRGPSDDSVLVHSDGGRVNQEHEAEPTEIPPAYDSIPADDRSP